MTKRVFIAEDEPNILESLSFLLRREGWEVASALDGNAALEHLNSGILPDVVILDIMLPHRDGFDILRQLRGSARTRDLPVIVLTQGAEGSQDGREKRSECLRDKTVFEYGNRSRVRRLAGL